MLKENIRYSARLLLGRVSGGGLGVVTLMTPEYLSIWNIKRWCQSRLSGCHYPSQGDEAGVIRRQVAWRETPGTGHQLTRDQLLLHLLHPHEGILSHSQLIPSHITQTYHHNPVTRRQVAWQPFMSSPHRTSRDPNTQQQAAGGWTGWIQIASGVRQPCANALCEAGCTFHFIFRNKYFHPSTRLPCFWVGHQPVLSSEHSTMA